MRFIIFILIACISDETTSWNNGDPIVTIDDGRIRGRRDLTADEHKPYIAFQGIPYAKPPIGKLRFSPPEKNAKWSGILDAIKDKPQCVQGQSPVSGSEDCLYVNVYTPSLTGKKAVMVFMFGGSFIDGNGSYSLFPPDWLLEEDVVYVSLNHRLGVFGFLSTLDTVAPGNLGLKDHCLALKWVHHNIRHFGGDPERITIFGQSSGAISVSYLLQSDCAKGTFQRAIQHSQSSLGIWAIHRVANRTAHAIAKFFNVDSSNTNEILEGLRKLDYKVLQQGSLAEATKIYLEDPLAWIQFAPVIEPYQSGAFYYRNYSDQDLSEGRYIRVPVMMGVNSNEAAPFKDLAAFVQPYLVKYDRQYELLAPVDLTKNLTKRREAGSVIKSHYFGTTPLSQQFDKYIEFFNDNEFYKPVRRTALHMGKYSPVYYYVFSYEGKLGGVVNRQLPGAAHGEELGYLFRQVKTNISASDKLTSNRMLRLWTNFAKFGNPTPQRDPVLQNVEWPLSSKVPNSLSYLNINKDLGIETNPFDQNMKFFDDIYNKYGDPPHDTF